MTELVAAAAILGIVVAAVVPLLGNVARVQRDSAARQLALREVANLLEQIAAARLSGELSDDFLAGLSVSPAARDLLDEPELSVTVSEHAGPPVGRELTVSLAWTNAAGQRAAPVIVTAIAYEPGGAR